MLESQVSLQETISLYKQASIIPNASANSVWDDLLSLIEGLVKKLLNSAIGGNGLTINDIIQSVKDKISSVITDVNTVVSGVTDTLTLTIGNAITLIDNFIGGVVKTVSDKVDTVISNISTAVTNITNQVTSNIQGLLSGIGDAISGAIQGLIDKIGSVITSIEAIGTQIATGIGNAISNIGDWIAGVVNDIVATSTAIISAVIESVKAEIIKVYNFITKTISDVVTGVGDWLKGLYEGIQKWFSDTLNNLQNTYETTKTSVEAWIGKALDWLQSVVDGISKWFWNTVTSIAGWIKANVIPKFDDAVTGAQTLLKIAYKVSDMLATGDYQGAIALIDGIFKGFGLAAPLGLIHGVVSAVAYFWQSVNIQFVPMQIAASKRANIALALDPISNTEASTAVYKGLWGEADFINNASLAGVSRDKAKVALQANRNIISPGQAQQLFLRGEIDEKEHDTILAAYGFSAEHIREIKALYAIIPSVSDIITMAVKEAFSPDIAKRFGQFDDLPSAFVSWAKKQGLSEDWASRYWAAHWDLPSPQMGFTMYQRGIIERDDLALLLKALDIMPFWREKLIQLSYNPLTRIDIRRMYKMGVIDADQVYKFHLDIGYSPENAKLLTDFTKRYSAPEDQSQIDTFAELARSTYSSAYRERIISADEYKVFLSGLKYADQDIELLMSLDDYAIAQSDKLFDTTSYRKDYMKLVTQAYNRGLFNRNDAKPLLTDLGLTEDQAELELSLLDYNRQLSIRDTLLTQLHNQFVGFMIDEVGLHSLLDTFGFYSNEVDRLIEEWNIERSYRDKRPSFADLKGFYTKGLITLDDLMDEIRGIGYHERYIPLYEQSLAKKG